MSSWGVCDLRRKPGRPIKWALPSGAECGPLRSWPKSTGFPWSPSGHTVPVGVTGAREHQLQGVSHVPCNLDVLLIIWSSSDRTCARLGSHSHSCAHQQLKRVFVSWGFTSSGQKPRSRGKGESNPSRSSASGPALKEQGHEPEWELCHLMHLLRHLCKTCCTVQAREFHNSKQDQKASKQNTLLYHLLLLHLVVEEDKKW